MTYDIGSVMSNRDKCQEMGRLSTNYYIMYYLSDKMLPVQREDITPKSISYDGGHEWQLAFTFHEIGGTKQRSDSMRFRTKEDAKRRFKEKADFFCKSMACLSGSVIDRKETKLVITVNDVKIVQISFLAVPLQCA